MTDVEAGGATVFPSLDLTLYPVKGAAAFWYNLFEDGVGDVSTRHAACPVLLGSKWGKHSSLIKNDIMIAEKYYLFVYSF
jgi:prolyl 4-hydroxylase